MGVGNEGVKGTYGTPKISLGIRSNFARRWLRGRLADSGSAQQQALGGSEPTFPDTIDRVKHSCRMERSFMHLSIRQPLVPKHDVGLVPKLFHGPHPKIAYGGREVLVHPLQSAVHKSRLQFVKLSRRAEYLLGCRRSDSASVIVFLSRVSASLLTFLETAFRDPSVVIGIRHVKRWD